MATIAIVIFNFLITIYIVFGLAILYHLKKYRWPGDLNMVSGFIFVAGSFFFVIMAISFFASVPWQSI